jgi:hypothetical protein
MYPILLLPFHGETVTLKLLNIDNDGIRAPFLKDKVDKQLL